MIVFKKQKLTYKIRKHKINQNLIYRKNYTNLDNNKAKI